MGGEARKELIDKVDIFEKVDILIGYMPKKIYLCSVFKSQ
jgi:hypothetical protein